MRPSRRGPGPTPNPRLAVVAQLQRRVLQLQARLCLTPKAFGFKADRVANARELEREARNLSREPPADPLAELMRMWENDRAATAASSPAGSATARAPRLQAPAARHENVGRTSCRSRQRLTATAKPSRPHD